jgi:hypothetical protein
LKLAVGPPRKRTRGKRTRAPLHLLFALALGGVAPAQDASKLEPVQWGPWHVLLPFDHPDGAKNIAAPTPVEDELKRMLAGGPGPDLQRAFQGKGGLRISWVEVGEGALKGPLPALAPIDFPSLVPSGAPAKSAENAVAYLYRRVHAEAPMTVEVLCGSDDGLRLWLNGKLIHEADRPRALEPFEDRMRLDLARGDNHLLAKIDQGGGPWRFRMQVERTASAEPDRRAAQERVNAAIDRGMEYLLATQQRDGSWGFKAGEFPSGQTALSIYTLLKSGLPGNHVAIQRGVAYLRAHSPQRTYAIGCALLALCALGGEEHREWTEDLVAELLAAQQGSFGYPSDARDLSNTQYAALGLWAASREGLPVPAKNWRELLMHTLRYQSKDGGFSYQIAGAPSGSMTAAGVTVLAIALDRMSEGGAKPAESQAVAEAAIARGIDWLTRHFAVSFNPVASGEPERRWSHYFLYGVERACTLRKVERLGSIDWYWEGAMGLLEAQGALGEWSTIYGEPESNTCFALLFLSRATASYATTGPSAGAHSQRKGEKVYATDDATSEVWLRASGDSPMVLWVAGFSPRAVATHAWTEGEVRGLRIQRVEYLIDDALAGTVEGDAQRGWKQERFPIKLRFATSGPHRVAARVHLLDPLAGSGDLQHKAPAEEIVLDSPALSVSIEQLIDEWMLTYAEEDARNLLRPLETTATASSAVDGNPASQACDNLQSTAWVCKADDAGPWLLLEFQKPLRASHLLLAQTVGARLWAGDYDRATRIEIRINKQEVPITVEMDPDEVKKTLVALPRTGVLRQLELRIVGRTAGKKHPGCVGLAEVELQYRR